jgi:hypothetical protein
MTRVLLLLFFSSSVFAFFSRAVSVNIDTEKTDDERQKKKSERRKSRR